MIECRLVVKQNIDWHFPAYSVLYRTLPKHGDQQTFERGESKNEETAMRKRETPVNRSCWSPPEDSPREGESLHTVFR